MMILQQMLGHLGLNANHSGEVLKTVLELMISSMDPWKRCHCIRTIELQTQLIDATVQGTTQELQKSTTCMSINMHQHHTDLDEQWLQVKTTSKSS